MAVKVTKPQVDLREEINQALTLSGLENQSITVNGLESKGKVQIGRNPRGYTGGHLFVHNDAGLDSTTKAELSDNAVLLLQPHSSNSTHMAIGQVNAGNGIGIQVTNASRTADWDIALNPFGGKVGIGTDAPTSKLTVDSNISSSSTTVIDILQSTNGADKQVAGIGVLVDNGGESTNAGGMFFQTASGGALTERLRLTSSGGLELGYAGATRQQADSQALSIITPASGGGQGIALKRLDSNTDQILGEISWSNNTQDGQANIRVKTDGAVNTTDMIFEVSNGGTVTEAIRIDGSLGGNVGIGSPPTSGTGDFDSAELLRVNGDAWSDSTDNQKGISLATNSRPTSAPLYFNEEKDSSAKAIYQEAYYIVVRGHNNEGIKFKGNGNPANTTYQFNGTNNSSSCFNASNSTNWNTTSDERIKENIQVLPNGSLAKINALRPVTFDYTDEWADKMAWWQFDEDGNKLDFNPERKNNEIGWIAQEYETLFPEDVTTSEETVGENTYEDFRTLKPDSVVPHLVKAMQELSAQVEALQAEINALKGE